MSTSTLQPAQVLKRSLNAGRSLAACLGWVADHLPCVPGCCVYIRPRGRDGRGPVQTVGLQVHCGTEGVNQNKSRYPETTQWCHRRGKLLERKVWAPNEEECTQSSLGRAWHIPQVEVSSWKVGDRHENWQGDNPGSAEGSIDSLCLCRAPTGCGDPPDCPWVVAFLRVG